MNHTIRYRNTKQQNVALTYLFGFFSQAVFQDLLADGAQPLQILPLLKPTRTVYMPGAKSKIGIYTDDTGQRHINLVSLLKNVGKDPRVVLRLVYKGIIPTSLILTRMVKEIPEPGTEEWKAHNTMLANLAKAIPLYAVSELFQLTNLDYQGIGTKFLADLRAFVAADVPTAPVPLAKEVIKDTLAETQTKGGTTAVSVEAKPVVRSPVQVIRALDGLFAQMVELFGELGSLIENQEATQTKELSTLQEENRELQKKLLVLQAPAPKLPEGRSNVISMERLTPDMRGFSATRISEDIAADTQFSTIKMSRDDVTAVGKRLCLLGDPAYGNWAAWDSQAGRKEGYHWRYNDAGKAQIVSWAKEFVQEIAASDLDKLPSKTAQRQRYREIFNNSVLITAPVGRGTAQKASM